MKLGTMCLTLAFLLCLCTFTAQPSDGSVLRGRGYAVYIDVPSLGVTDSYYVDTGWLPPEGGLLSESATAVDVPGVLSAGTLAATTDDDDCSGDTVVALDDVVILPGHPGEIVFVTLTSDDDDDCCEDDDTPHDATIAGLTFGGTPVVVTGAMNQSIVLEGVGTLVLNELISQDDDDDDCEDDSDLAIAALHLYLDDGGQVIVGWSYLHFDDECCAVPTETINWSSLKTVYR